MDKSKKIDNIVLTGYFVLFVAHLIMFNSIEPSSSITWLVIIGVVSSSFGMGMMVQKKSKVIQRVISEN